jgi:cytochrome c553
MTTRARSIASATRSRLIRCLGVAALLAALVAAGSAPVSAADAEAGRRKSEPCATCHGADGNATTPGIPSLAGQPTFFTHWQLIKFRDGRRKDEQMSPFAANLTDDDMADLAAFYAAQKPLPRRSAIDPAKAAGGRELTIRHHCASCHRPNLEGQKQVARLAGQDLTYLLKLLRGFKAQTASDLEGTMTMAAQPLTPEEIESLAHYIAGLTP